MKPAVIESNPGLANVHPNFSKYILHEKDWTLDNFAKLSIICQRAFASGDFWLENFDLHLQDSKGIFALEWCNLFNWVLLPFLDDSPNTSFGLLDNKIAVLEAPVKVTNFSPGTFLLPRSINNLREYQNIEPCFHRITSNVCPLANLLLSPMGICIEKDRTDLQLKSDEYGIEPYIVPEVNHRQKNPNLVSSLLSDTLMCDTPSDHFRAEYTVLPFRMVAESKAKAWAERNAKTSSSNKNKSTSNAALASYDPLGDFGLVGEPKAFLFGNSDEVVAEGDGECNTNEPTLMFRALRGEENKNSPELSVDDESLLETAQEMETLFLKSIRLPESELVNDRLKELGIHTMTKQLINRHILKFASETDTLGGIFSNFSALIKRNVPSLRPFFPYCMTSPSIYPFHHGRVLLGALTTTRVSMLEGNHRSFVSVTGLFGGLLGRKGHKAAETNKTKLNTGLLLQTAKVIDCLPCLPDARPCDMNEMVRDHRLCFQFLSDFANHKYFVPT